VIDANELIEELRRSGKVVGKVVPKPLCYVAWQHVLQLEAAYTLREVERHAARVKPVVGLLPVATGEVAQGFPSILV
jgi:hypothetical protein